MNELQSLTDIDEVIQYTEREAEGCHQMASAYHTDEGVYLQEETRFQYKAMLWENIHEWLEELKELRKKQRPHGKWIPVSERLPEEKINPVTHDFEEVLCTTIWGDVRHYKYGKVFGHDKAHFWYGWGIMDEEVIAWMPSPKPYQKEGESK